MRGTSALKDVELHPNYCFFLLASLNDPISTRDEVSLDFRRLSLAMTLWYFFASAMVQIKEKDAKRVPSPSRAGFCRREKGEARMTPAMPLQQLDGRASLRGWLAGWLLSSWWFANAPYRAVTRLLAPKRRHRLPSDKLGRSVVANSWNEYPS